MRIPPDFIEKFGENIPTKVTLRRPNMRTWQVDVKKIDEHWFLEKGWPQFVKENSVQDGDFLTFSYAGNSIFFFKVFARNGCRKRVDTIADDGQSIESSQSPG
ncbi:B3 domain-containing protein at4g34400 [Phtheirospermum japonicum]|uniref:B3 domain-containing protein at4g34400 n=1 Tax=Phtheirospermum japonicum TaxID=374723 RepID=A0A830C718_9LAMI|nr:B3 domain-containing protein at4g34400 [Phtheirospermum japonicum]